jgi:hypothetical protein
MKFYTMRRFTIIPIFYYCPPDRSGMVSIEDMNRGWFAIRFLWWAVAFTYRSKA